VPQGVVASGCKHAGEKMLTRAMGATRTTTKLKTDAPKQWRKAYGEARRTKALTKRNITGLAVCLRLTGTNTRPTCTGRIHAALPDQVHTSGPGLLVIFISSASVYCTKQSALCTVQYYCLCYTRGEELKEKYDNYEDIEECDKDRKEKMIQKLPQSSNDYRKLSKWCVTLVMRLECWVCERTLYNLFTPDLDGPRVCTGGKETAQPDQVQKNVPPHSGANKRPYP